MNRLLTFLILLILSLTTVSATPSNGTVTRIFSSLTISQGDPFTVTLTPGGYVTDGFYQIRETIPGGFIFDSTNSDDANVSGRDIIFTEMTGTSLRYTLTPSTPGTFSFEGTFTDNDRNNGTTDGSNQITISPTLKITREINKNYIYLENSTDVITITLSTSETGLLIYGIVEMIPEDLTLTLLTTENINMTRESNNYTFITLSNHSIPTILQYTLSPTTTSTIGNRTIQGYYKTSPDIIIPITSTMFRIASSLFQAYDINDDNRLQKSEIMSAAWDYFAVPNKMSFDSIAGLVKQYLML